MTTLEQAARQAMEALELHAKQYPYMQKGYTVDAIADLHQALEQPKQEPVAWCRSDTVADWKGQILNIAYMFPFPKGLKNPIPLYTEPPKREWVGLTEKEIEDVLIDLPVSGNGYFIRIARAIEAALKTKNT